MLKKKIKDLERGSTSCERKTKMKELIIKCKIREDDTVSITHKFVPDINFENPTKYDNYLATLFKTFMRAMEKITEK